MWRIQIYAELQEQQKRPCDVIKKIMRNPFLPDVSYQNKENIEQFLIKIIALLIYYPFPSLL